MATRKAKPSSKPRQVTVEDEAEAFQVDASEVEKADAQAASSKVAADKPEGERIQVWVKLDDDAQQAWRDSGVDLPFPAIVRIVGDLHAAGILKSKEMTEDGKLSFTIGRSVLLEKILPNRVEYLESRPIKNDQAMRQFNEATNHLDFMIKKNPEADFSSIEGLRDEVRVRILDTFDNEDDGDLNREIFEKSQKIIENSNRVACQNIWQGCLKLSSALGEGVQESVNTKLAEIEPLMQSNISKAKAKLTKLMAFLEQLGSGSKKIFNSPHQQQRNSKTVSELRRSRRRGQAQQQ